MTETDSGAQTFAALALALLDTGALDDLRALLVEQVNVAHTDSWARSSQLQLVATKCAIGLPPSAVARTLDGVADIIDPTIFLRRSVGSMATAASGPLTHEALGTLLIWMGENTDQLLSARACMAAVSVGAAHASLTRTESPLEDHLHPAPSQSDDKGRERSWILELLSAHSAVRTTNERATKRVVYWARVAGLTQREVAESMHKPQTHVFRQLQEIDADPRILAMTPRELHDHFRAGHIARAQLLALLAAYNYDSGTFPADAPEWGYVPGSFDELTQLAAEGSISHEELDVVLAGVEALVTADE
ncbi:MAG: hypothetical protein JWN36_445 [Microbacteriaceae bacterium]|nr:hypothetical protein [Microbacteriaceae bacterium]